MVKISLFTGPYIACGVGGTIWESGQSVKDLKFGGGADKDIRFFDLGLNCGIGVSIKKFMVTAQYGWAYPMRQPIKPAFGNEA